MTNQLDLKSRIGLRAIVAGTLVSITAMILLLSLMAALGLFNFYLDEMATASISFWISLSLSWALAMFCGGFIASLSCRPMSKTEGLLNALCANCSFFLLFGIITLFLTPRVVISLFTMATPQLFLRGFLVDLICFTIGSYGGILGVNFEKHNIQHFQKKRHFVASS